MIVDTAAFVKRHFILSSHHIAKLYLPKMTADTPPVVHIRTFTLPEPVPDLLGHICVPSDSSASGHSNLQQRPLGIVANSINVRTAKTF